MVCLWALELIGVEWNFLYDSALSCIIGGLKIKKNVRKQSHFILSLIKLHVGWFHSLLLSLIYLYDYWIWNLKLT